MKHIQFLSIFILFFFCSCWTNDYSHTGNTNAKTVHDYAGIMDKGVLDTAYTKSHQNKDRDIWQKPEKVIEMLGEISNQTIADLGAGYGYFSFRLAEEAKKVIAVDIDPNSIAYMDSMYSRLQVETVQDKFETRLADTNNAMLEDGEVDAIVVVNTYAYIENRISYFNKLISALKSGGKLLVVDYKSDDLPEGYGPPKDTRTSKSDVINELEEAGYRLQEVDDSTLEYQYIILVMKP